MKNTVLKFYITVVCLFSNLFVFADPGDESDDGGLQTVDPVPINGKLIFLILAGIILAVYTFRSKKINIQTQ